MQEAVPWWRRKGQALPSPSLTKLRNTRTHSLTLFSLTPCKKIGNEQMFCAKMLIHYRTERWQVIKRNLFRTYKLHNLPILKAPFHEPQNLVQNLKYQIQRQMHKHILILPRKDVSTLKRILDSAHTIGKMKRQISNLWLLPSVLFQLQSLLSVL